MGGGARLEAPALWLEGKDLPCLRFLRTPGAHVCVCVWLGSALEHLLLPTSSWTAALHQERCHRCAKPSDSCTIHSFSGIEHSPRTRPLA